MRSLRKERAAAIRQRRQRPPRIDPDAPARLLSEQNLPLALIAGGVAAVAGVLLWVFSRFEQPWYYTGDAVVIGFVCGYAVRHAGRGVDPIFGFVAGGLAALACITGTVIIEDLGLHTLASVLIAGYAGHWFAFRELTKSEADALWRHRMGVLERPDTDLRGGQKP